MENKTVDFGNVIEELENKELQIVFLQNRGMFLQDTNRNLYQFETHMIGSYLDNLIKKREKITFLLVPKKISENIGEWEKEVWDTEEVKAFIKRQKL